MSANECYAARSDPRHRFTCPLCRADARITAAWKTLSASADAWSADDADESYVSRVLSSVRSDRLRLRRQRAWLAAAAALLFFFFAGLSQEASSRPAPAPDDAYASLASPDDLAELVAN